jgi:hypothetical protein
MDEINDGQLTVNYRLEGLFMRLDVQLKYHSSASIIHKETTILDDFNYTQIT